MSNEERSLGDVLPESQEVKSVDTTVTPVPEDFDIDAWLSGVRPTRRSVKLYPQAHLVARLEQIAVEIDETPDGVNVDDLIDEFEQVKSQFREGVWFTVEARSQEWLDKIRKDLTKRLNLDPKKDSDVMIINLHILAEQIVSPAGWTYNRLKQLKAASEGEMAKLMDTCNKANSNLAESAGVLDRDFSVRRSVTNQD